MPSRSKKSKVKVVQKPRVMVGIPHTGWLAAHTHQSILGMFRSSKSASLISEEMIGGSYHHTARNGLAWNMLHSPEDYTHLLFIDSDISFEYDCLDRLIAHDLDVVGGLVFQKGAPFPACCLMQVDDLYCPLHDVTHEAYFRHMNAEELRGEGVIEVASVGYGFTLFKREVFEKIPYPWFSLPANEDTATHGMWQISMVGEDIYFARKATKNGVKMYLDRDMKCGHFGNQMFTYEMWELYDKLYSPKPKDLKKAQSDWDKSVKNKEVCIIGLEGDFNGGDNRDRAAATGIQP